MYKRQAQEVAAAGNDEEEDEEEARAAMAPGLSPGNRGGGGGAYEALTVRAAQAAAGALGQKGVGRSARDEAEALVIKLFEDASGSRSDDAREAKIEQIMMECSRPPLLNVGKQR